ncbi:hypothetical protein [Streptomyces sp. NPDC088812]|uniref:hypothetical protein n=1 Tax=Streptomyces sp. NPDC088812 TaxID=3365905 RepID=UPI00381913B0
MAVVQYEVCCFPEHSSVLRLCGLQAHGLSGGGESDGRSSLQQLSAVCHFWLLR